MTKKNRTELQQAVNFLMNDDGWERGMEILLRLAGMRMPSIEAAKDLNLVDVRSLPKESRPFSFDEPRTKA
jgi:hypothetical protein